MRLRTEDDLAGLGDGDRQRAQDEDAADPRLEGADPLAHGRRGDVEGPGSRLEGPMVDDGPEGGELIGVHGTSLHPYEADVHSDDFLALPFIPAQP